MRLEEAISNAKSVPTTGKRGGGRQICSISIVNCDNGKRLALSKTLFEEMGNPATVQVAMDKKHIFIGESLGKKDGNDYNVSDKGRGYIYSASLVEYISEEFDLDFSDKTSITLTNVKVKDCNGYPIAIVTFQTSNEDD